jgi:hypothetical protein
VAGHGSPTTTVLFSTHHHLLSCLVVVPLARSSAQIGNEVFLKGRYMEVGVHTVGSFGTA